MQPVRRVPARFFQVFPTSRGKPLLVREICTAVVGRPWRNISTSKNLDCLPFAASPNVTHCRALTVRFLQTGSMCFTRDSTGFGIFGGNRCFCIHDDVEGEGYYNSGRKTGVCELTDAGDSSTMMCRGDNAYDLFQSFHGVPGGTINKVADGSMAGTAATTIGGVETDFGKSNKG